MAGRILIVTADASHTRFLEDCLRATNDGMFIPRSSSRLDSALEILQSDPMDAILADLSLPDGRGMAVFEQLLERAPDTPIILFAEPDDEAHAIDALQQGAQGYLTKGRFSSAFIVRLISNVVARKTMEESLFIEKTRTEVTLDSISDSVITTDRHGNVDYLNQAAEKMTGWSKEDALGRPIREVMTVIASDTHQPDINPGEQVLRTGASVTRKSGVILLHRDGGESTIEEYAVPIHDSTGKSRGAVVVFHDISASKEMTERMAHLAQHDFLTDLPNRVLLQDRISQAIELAARRGTTLAVLFLDLDNFKPINDSLGHDVGDKLLCAVAKRLSACVRSSDTVSRSGGDEFIILVQGEDRTDNTTTVARKIRGAFADPFLISSHELHVTASIGISLYPTDAREAEPLIKKADIAMYEAKCQGGNNYQFYNLDMNRHVMPQHVEAKLKHHQS